MFKQPWSSLSPGTLLLVFALSAAWPKAAGAQVPFINGGVTAFSPEISVVNTGVLLDVQGTVSPDRRYVTITARPQSSQLLSLQNFTFQGAVGATTVGTPTPGIAPLIRPGLVNPPITLGAGAGVVLSQRGTTKILVPRPSGPPR